MGDKEQEQGGEGKGPGSFLHCRRDELSGCRRTAGERPDYRTLLIGLIGCRLLRSSTLSLALTYPVERELDRRGRRTRD